MAIDENLKPAKDFVIDSYSVDRLRIDITDATTQAIDPLGLQCLIRGITYTPNGCRMPMEISQKVGKNGLFLGTEIQSFNEKAKALGVGQYMLGTEFLEPLRGGRYNLYVLGGMLARAQKMGFVVIDISNPHKPKRLHADKGWLTTQYNSAESERYRARNPKKHDLGAASDFRFTTESTAELQDLVQNAVNARLTPDGLEFVVRRFVASEFGCKSQVTVNKKLGEFGLLRSVEVEIFKTVAKRHNLDASIAGKTFIGDPNNGVSQICLVGGARNRATTNMCVIYDVTSVEEPVRFMSTMDWLKTHYFSPESELFREMDGALTAESVEEAFRVKNASKVESRARF